MTTSTTQTPDLPAASGLTGQTTDLPTPGEYPSLDAQSQVPIIMGVCAGFMVLSTLVVSARLYTRYGLIKAAGEDDITIIAAQVWRDEEQASVSPPADKPPDLRDRTRYHHHTA